MFTTDESAPFTTGAKPACFVSLAGANFTSSAADSKCLALANPRPPMPTTSPAAKSAFGPLLNFSYMSAPVGIWLATRPDVLVAALTSRTGRARSPILPGSRYRSPRRLGRALGHDAFAYRVEDQLGNVVQLQFLHHLRAMRLHRIDAQLQEVCNLLARLSLRHQLQHLAFAGREQFKRILRAGSLELSHVILEQNLAHCGAKEGFAGGDGTDRAGQIGLGRILQQVSLGSGFQRSQYIPFVGMHTEHDD